MAKKTETKIEYVDVTSEEVRAVIGGITEAVDKMIHDFDSSMRIMGQISRVLKESPPNMEIARLLLDEFFGIEVPDPELEEDAEEDAV